MTTAKDDPLRIETVREYLKLSGAGEIYRRGWLAAFDKNKSLGEPYWPESFWLDMRQEMMKADLSPMVLQLYGPNISNSMLKSANGFLLTKSMADLAETSFGAKLCKLEQEDDRQSSSLTLSMTQEILIRVYVKDKPQIKAAREKYLVAHPGYKD